MGKIERMNRCDREMQTAENGLSAVCQKGFYSFEDDMLALSAFKSIGSPKPSSASLGSCVLASPTTNQIILSGFA